jgi:hypothetical protein
MPEGKGTTSQCGIRSPGGPVGANHTDALLYLREALTRGYKDADGLMADNSLKNLRENPHFREIIGELKPSSTKCRPNSARPLPSSVAASSITWTPDALAIRVTKAFTFIEGIPNQSSSIRFEGVRIRVGHRYPSAGHPRPADRVEPRKLPLAAPRITPGLLAPFALGSLSGEIQDQLSKLTHTA